MPDAGGVAVRRHNSDDAAGLRGRSAGNAARVIAIAGSNALRNVGRRASAGAGNTYGDGADGCADDGPNPGSNPDRHRRDNGRDTGHSGHLCAPAIPGSVHGGAHARCAAAGVAHPGGGGY